MLRPDVVFGEVAKHGADAAFNVWMPVWEAGGFEVSEAVTADR